jgi:hypothetical protein
MGFFMRGEHFVRGQQQEQTTARTDNGKYGDSGFARMTTSLGASVGMTDAGGFDQRRFVFRL